MNVGAPFFAALLYNLMQGKAVYEPSCPTAQTNGEEIQVGDWFVALPLEERIFVLGHECVHAMLDHPYRAKLYIDRGFGPDMLPFDMKRWNAACDYVNNAMLIQARLGRMPENALLDARFTAEMMSDVVYCQLPPNDEDDKQDKSRGKPGGKDGFDVHLPSPVDQQDARVRDAKRNAAISAAVTTAKLAGAMPGALERVVGKILRPEKPWREMLADFMQQHAGSDETSWSKIRRRSLVVPPHIPMPGRTGYSMDSMVIAVDVSGSISGKTLREFLGAIAEIKEQVKPRVVHAVWWDCAAVTDDVSELMPDDIEDLRPKGGGGTDYSCVPPAIADLPDAPDVVVCLTDGYVDWPSEHAITWPHVTVTTTSREAPFGRTIRMNDK